MSGARFAKFKIKKFRKEIEPQEILLDSLAQKKERELGISEKKLLFLKKSCGDCGSAF